MGVRGGARHLQQRHVRKEVVADEEGEHQEVVDDRLERVGERQHLAVHTRCEVRTSRSLRED